LKTFNQLINDTDVFGINYPFALRTVRRGGEWIDIDICNKNLLDCNEVFKEHKVLMWLMFGTLLGASRDGKLMNYDTDVDVGIFRRDTIKAAAAMKDLCKNHGFKLIRNVTLDSTITLMRDDEYVDFYVFNECAIWYLLLMEPEVCVLKDYQLNDLQTIQFLGTEFYIPNDCEKDFSIWYGDTWRTPIKGKHYLK